MNDEELAKKLLLNETCDTCVFYIKEKIYKDCVMLKNYKYGTCNNWELKVYLEMT